MSSDALADLRPHDTEILNRDYTAAIYHINSARSASDFALAVEEVGHLFERYPTTHTLFKQIEGIESRFASEGHIEIIASKFEKFMQETDPDVRVPKAILNATNKLLRNNIMRKPIITSTLPKTSMSAVAKFQDETLARDTAMLIASKVGKDIVLLEKDRARSFALIILATLRLHSSDEKLISSCLPVIKCYSYFFDIINDCDLLANSVDSVLPSIALSSTLLEIAFDILAIATIRKANFNEQCLATAEKVTNVLHSGNITESKSYAAVMRWVSRTSLPADEVAAKIIALKLTSGIECYIREVYESDKEAFRHATVIIALSREESLRAACRRNLEAIEMVILSLEYALKTETEVLDRYMHVLQHLNKLK
jgi:hypothetical protein